MSDTKDLKHETPFDDERTLRDLLARWETPGTPPSLDRRMLASYRQMQAARELLPADQSAEVWRTPTERAATDRPLPTGMEARMKKCPNCSEEFADKFSFCPVDGTPLNALAAALVASPPPDAPEEITAGALVATARNAPVSRDEDLHLTILEDKGLVRRLAAEIALVAHQSQLTWPEFKRDPFGFSRRLLAGYGRAAWSAVARPAVALALLTAVATIGLIMGAVVLFDRYQTPGQGISRGAMAALTIGAVLLLAGLLTAWLKRERPQAVEGVGAWGAGRVAESGSSGNDLAAVVASLVFVSLLGVGLFFGSRFMTMRAASKNEDLVVESIVEPTDIPKEEEKPEKEGPAGNEKGKGGGSKPKYEKPQGGGGGGREEETRPVSKGETPPMSQAPQIVVPKVQPPPDRPTLLPQLATLKGDPLLTKMPKTAQFGDPNSQATDPSPGKGEGEGFGGGKGTGAGKGEGAGLGPGRGENTGGGDTNYGGGGKGGGGGGAPKPPEVDYDRPFRANEVTRKAVITAKPEPPYTEAARKNNVTGTVQVRVLLASNGSVTQASAVTRLPDGLTEQAVSAARRIRFTPAQKDGHTVSQWVVVEYTFNLY